MDLGIAGRRAFITGGSLGIGRACAAELARAGVDVVITARNEGRLRAAAEELSSNSGGRVIPVPADISRSEDIGRAIAAAHEALGGIDILVNNAGASPAGRLGDITDAQWRESFDLKIMGYVRCMRALIPVMRERKWGRVINIIGRGGHQPSAGYVLGSFNALLLNLVQAVAEECIRDGVTVTGINPGATATPRWQTLTEQRAKIYGRSVEEQREIDNEHIPAGRPGTPEEVAALAAFLCSEHAGMISGAWVNIDGASSKGL